MTLPQIVGLGGLALVALIFLASGLLAWHERRLAARELDKFYDDRDRRRGPSHDSEERVALFTTEQWYALPLSLRRRWWEETNYNRRPPSAELSGLIVAAIWSKE